MMNMVAIIQTIPNNSLDFSCSYIPTIIFAMPPNGNMKQRKNKRASVSFMWIITTLFSFLQIPLAL